MAINVSAIKKYLMQLDKVDLPTVQQEFSLTYSQVRKIFSELLKQDAVSFISGFTYKIHKSHIVAWDSEGGGLDGIDPNDELLLKALWLCLVNNNVSASGLQQKLSIGYSLASKLVDRLDKLGLISYSKRKVLVSADEYVKRFGTPDLSK